MRKNIAQFVLGLMAIVSLSISAGEDLGFQYGILSSSVATGIGPVAAPRSQPALFNVTLSPLRATYQDGDTLTVSWPSLAGYVPSEAGTYRIAVLWGCDAVPGYYTLATDELAQTATSTTIILSNQTIWDYAGYFLSKSAFVTESEVLRNGFIQVVLVKKEAGELPLALAIGETAMGFTLQYYVAPAPTVTVEAISFVSTVGVNVNYGLTAKLTISPAGTAGNPVVRIDWGDGTNSVPTSSNSGTGLYSFEHRFSKAGIYTLIVTAEIAGTVVSKAFTVTVEAEEILLRIKGAEVRTEGTPISAKVYKFTKAGLTYTVVVPEGKKFRVPRGYTLVPAR